MVTAHISFEFLKRLRAMPSWAEIAYGFERQLLPPNVVIDYAMDKIATADEPNDDELAIASSSLNDSIAERVKKLATEDEANDEDALRVRWANILLAWIYEHRDGMDDPLSVVEEIYADYNYPEEFGPFVRYMPSDAPDLGSVEANEQRMIASIGEYVEEFVVRRNT